MSQNTPTRTTVAASATVVNLFTAVGVGSTSGGDAVNRIVYNDSSADLCLAYGAAATTTDFTVRIPANGYWEAPQPVFDGLVTGIWSAATGSARCTEVLS